MSKQNLSPEQESIVHQWLENDAPMLVEASAGSGKTRVLTESVRRIVAFSPKSRSKILCLTYTVRAAEEMQERLKDLSNLKERAFIGTIHAFALDIIKSRSHELGMIEMPTIIDKDSDRKEILVEVFLSNPLFTQIYLQPSPKVVQKFKTIERYQTDLLNKYLNFISHQKKALVWLEEESDYPIGRDWTAKRIALYKDYNAILSNQNLIDYDDIILLAWKILSERPLTANLYQRIYEYVLVDEAQDLSFAQYELIKAFCGQGIKKIMMVGDAKQAIYGYTGASSQFMKEHFVRDFSLTTEQQRQIKYNYRSSQSIVELANGLLAIQQQHTENYYSGNIEFIVFENEELEASWIVEQLHQIVGIEKKDYDGKLTLDKVAILGRNRFVFNQLIEKLEADKIFNNQFFLKRGAGALNPQSTTMKIFDLGTRILSNQRAYLYYNQLMDVLDVQEDKPYLDAEGIDILREALSKNNLDYITNDVLDCLVECWESIERDINRFSDSLSKIQEISSTIGEENERELLYHDIKEWQEAWDKYIRSVPAKSKSISDFRRFIAMGITKAHNQQGLTLATVHSVKGLEFHVVFLMGMGQGTFPDYRAIRKGDVIEEKNNAYVAVTRAKRDLYITYPISKSVPWGTKKQQKSQFFIDKEFVKNMKFISVESESI